MVLSTDLQEHTWNRLIEDFIGAVRNDDKDHKNYPSLPTLNDALRTEEVIDAAPPVEQHWTLGNRWRMKERLRVR